VDAGAQGLVHLLGGITAFITHGRIREMDDVEAESEADEEPVGEALESPAFRYCTQFVIQGSDIDTRAIRSTLDDLGDSLIVAGSAARARIHVHTDAPAEALRRIEPHGAVTSQRVEDMVAQYRAAHGAHSQVALVVDSSCDLPAEVWERHNIHVVPCLLLFDGRTYLDKLTIDPRSLFSMLRRTRAGCATTSQPSPADFGGKLEFLGRHFRSTVVLTLPASISGTYDSARTGARLAGGDVTVIDTMTTSIGMGLIARRAAEAIEAGASRDEVIALVRRLVSGVRVHVTVRSLDNLVRSGRVSRVKGLVATLLGLKPVLSLGVASGGRPVHGSTVLGVRGGRRRILQTLRREIPEGVPVEFGIAHANAPQDAEWFRSRIAGSFALARETFVVEATTVLANHIGEGAVGLAWLAAGP
jgi:DegV family protein with EDD domain